MMPRFLALLWDGIAPALKNHLWQSTCFLLLAALLALALRRNHARARYWLWLAASIKFLVPFSLLVALGSHINLPHRPAAPAQAGIYVAVDEFSEPFVPGVNAPVALPLAAPSATGRDMEHVLPRLLAAVWFAGFAIVLCVWAVYWRRVSAAVRHAVPIGEGRELATLRRLERAAGVTQGMEMKLVFPRQTGEAGLTPRLRSGQASGTQAGVMEPGIFGIARPVLIWPRGMSARLDDAHLEAILAHEVCHVRWRDNLTAAVHMLVEAIFWFHPLVWWLGARLVEERERACDEEVLRLCNRPEVYAEGILKVCEFCLESPLPCVSGVTGSDLKRRIGDILAGRMALKLGLDRKLLLLAAALLVFAVPIVLGQAKATQRMALAAMNAAPAPIRVATRAMLAAAAPIEIAQASAPEGAPAPSPAAMPTPAPKTAVPAKAAGAAQGTQDIAGTWQGTAQVGQTMRIVLKISKADNAANNGGWKGALYSIDTSDQPMAIPSIAVTGADVKFTVPSSEISYQGKLSADGSSMTGTGMQGSNSYALNFDRVTDEAAWTIPDSVKPMALDAKPAYGVATIKPSDPNNRKQNDPYNYGMRGFESNGRHLVAVNETVNDMISWAYGIHAKQIAGGPVWFSTDRYIVDGVPDVKGWPNLKQQKAMLQQLLADRFKLAFHREQRELPMYAITVSKGGPKLKKNEDDPNGLPNQTGNGNGSQMTFKFTNNTIADFAQCMQTYADRPLVDQTGLAGRWNFVLKWTLNELNTTDPNAPPGLFTAIQEQLGLKLEPVKAQADVLVIDQAERPSEN